MTRARAPRAGARRPTGGLGLGPRLWLAQSLVVAVGALTAWAVASSVAPALFATHMGQAGSGVTPQVTLHARAAFASASELSLAVALIAALLASVAASAYIARRLARSLRPLSLGAAEVARARYEVRIDDPGLGREFADVVGAFNQMAARLDTIEETRRRLLADLAHELRTPLATLSAYLEAIEDGVTACDADTLALMQAQTGRLTRLARDLAAVSVAEEQMVTVRRVIAPAELVEAARSAAASRFEAGGVALVCSLTGPVPPVEVDPDRLAQVLGNLLDNALRHTPSGGRVEVGVDVQPGFVRVRVRDSGEGIAAEHLPHIFERFYRVDSAREHSQGGSGIGLAIVKAIVTAHGGRVAATSEGLGAGTCITVLLPPAP